jgi:hypothetical protein
MHMLKLAIFEFESRGGNKRKEKEGRNPFHTRPLSSASRAPVFLSLSLSLCPVCPPRRRAALSRALSLFFPWLVGPTHRPRPLPHNRSLHRGRAHVTRFARISTAHIPRPLSHAPRLGFKVNTPDPSTHTPHLHSPCSFSPPSMQQRRLRREGRSAIAAKLLSSPLLRWASPRCQPLGTRLQFPFLPLVCPALAHPLPCAVPEPPSLFKAATMPLPPSRWSWVSLWGKEPPEPSPFPSLAFCCAQLLVGVPNAAAEPPHRGPPPSGAPTPVQPPPLGSSHPSPSSHTILVALRPPERLRPSSPASFSPRTRTTPPLVSTTRISIV